MAGGFDSLGLMPELMRAVGDLSWYLPTDVQDEAIPLILGGGDVMVAAETGSGKTAAFCLPIIQSVHERLRDNDSAATNIATTGDMKPNNIKMNVNDRDNMLSISEDGCTCSSSADKQWVGARATHGVKGGRFYYEVTIVSSGICRVGWSSMAAHHELGKDNHGFGYGGTSMKSHAGKFEAYGSEYGVGDSIGCHLDLDNNTLSYSLNGIDKGVAFTVPESLRGTVLFPAVVIKGGSASINFGLEPAHFPPMEGFQFIEAATSQYIFSAQSREAFKSQGKRNPLAVILEPARDLAEQVYQAILDLSKYVTGPEIRAILLIGGDDQRKQQRILEKGVDIVVGTTGRICDMIKSKAIDFSQAKFFVLDEADRLIETENLPGIMQVYKACPAGGFGDNRLQVCFFSATLHSPAITELAAQLCQNPTWVDLKGVDSVPDTVHHVVFRVDPIKHAKYLSGTKTTPVTDAVHDLAMNKLVGDDLNSQRIKQIKLEILLQIIDKFQMSQCMIFCRTNVDCDNLETFLNNHGGGKKFTKKMESGKENPYSCCVLAGMRTLSDRRTSLDAFKDGYVRFLICTDVAARGIDIQGLPYVINMTLPDEAENYIHRIGRVGRADRMGLALSIVASEDAKERVWYHKCANRGKGCTNRKLVDNDGCTIWYDEAKLLKAVEKRLRIPIPELTAEFQLPPEIAALGVVYGEDAKAVESSANLHLGMIAPAVKELAEMEIQAQNSFLKFKSQFSTL